ncbi:MAG: prolipoprotein diacylglyceryl transferase [Spirochaetes bacterium]|nr:prolipoprotein diacylglyceryl transferase [Spirochaetota bacterium]MBU0955872.1 prolipoprotein diacylglyceryl transferase [Spirochaetota bacterium]
MLAAVQFPSWLKPEVLPFWPQFPLRWYGVMYLVAFAVAWLLFRRQVKERKLGYSEDDISNFFLVGILGLILGARLFGTLIYDTTGIYWRKPWLIFWPFSTDGQFTGFMGMSFHGGVVGGLGAMLIYGRIKKIEILRWLDMVAVAIPFGYTFGRLGNFINGELWGKVSSAPWAMVFPHAPRLPTNLDWVRQIAMESSLAISGSSINLARHPSQLYEALFEGIVLGLFMWLVIRKRHAFKGLATGCFVAGYGFVRFFIEYFREPDADLGYIIKLGDPDASIHLFTTPWNFSMGQLLCFLMIAGGLGFILLRRKLNAKEALAAESSKVTSSARKGHRRKTYKGR